jgi:hypothetical protein
MGWGYNWTRRGRRGNWSRRRNWNGSGRRHNLLLLPSQSHSNWMLHLLTISNLLGTGAIGGGAAVARTLVAGTHGELES